MLLVIVGGIIRTPLQGQSRLVLSEILLHKWRDVFLYDSHGAQMKGKTLIKCLIRKRIDVMSWIK